MRAIVYSTGGGPEVLQLVERPDPEPGPGEVLVRVAVSGVNPTDFKSRRGYGSGSPPNGWPEVIPNQDGAGTIEKVGPEVDPDRVGQRVWLWEAAWHKPDGGTAAELVTIPEHQAVPLPARTTFDLGATLGIPYLTAHRCLTVTEDGPHRLEPGALRGKHVLVQGGAGAVGHAAIELAKWADADVITTVSSAAKGELAEAAGADHVINYKEEDTVGLVRLLAPRGVDIIVEVAPAENMALDLRMLGANGVIAAYASGKTGEASVPVGPLMRINGRLQFVLVYTVSDFAKANGVVAVSQALTDKALHVGEAYGLPITRFPLEQMADAHAAVEAATVGKVLVDVSAPA